MIRIDWEKVKAVWESALQWAWVGIIVFLLFLLITPDTVVVDQCPNIPKVQRELPPGKVLTLNPRGQVVCVIPERAWLWEAQRTVFVPVSR